MTVAVHPSAKTKRRIHVTEAVTAALIALAMIAVHLMFFFWPFRYREVHPLLEEVFESKVTVSGYHRTYFPNPGFVAEGVTFYRHGDTRIPPLATVRRMTVKGQWGMLLFHPHLLYEIRLQDLHVQIPPAGTIARGKDFDNGVVDTTGSKLKIETICADGTVLDFLRNGYGPIRFNFPALQIHDLTAGRPMDFSLRVITPGPEGTLTASGKIGPFRTSSYATTPLSGTYEIKSADLSRLEGLAGHVRGGGRFSGKFTRIEVDGTAAIPDFRAADAHTVGLATEYRIAVNGANSDVQIERAQVKTGSSVITASGTVAGSPRRVAVAFATQAADVQDLLRMVETAEPEVAGKVNLDANAEFTEGPQPFLEKLRLKGDVAVEGLRFVDAKKQQTMDAFSERVRKDAPKDANGGDPPQVTLAARSETRFDHGMAYFPQIRAVLPGATARLHGTFGLLDSRVHLKGTVALDKSISHATTGWKSVLLKPLSPFFKKKNVGALVPIAVTGTAQSPKVGADIF
ncbi:MAG TPA: AsmA-like C-terminal region-containing protein [Acidobacteriaceae bacterium]|nr:AsmA-like C-terminal region-containing protein [Acidobacteriaceae bacterium]